MAVVTLETIRQARETTEDDIHKFLGSKGWAYTSQTPNCVWYWVKEFNGVKYALSQQDALNIEGYLED